MMPPFLRYTEDGYLVILPEDDPEGIVDAMLATNYREEFCLSPSFEPGFLARLMKAGFLVMSTRLGDDEPAQYITLPKLHLERSLLFFDKVHVKKSIRHFLPRYELRIDTDFDFILDRCVQVHDDGWLTKPLCAAIQAIRAKTGMPVRPTSFGVYRGGELKAGEFGIISGKIYTSYSGYYDEDNAGTVQMLLTARYLETVGCPFWDLGMPLPYKYELGAETVGPETFVPIFRAGGNS
jgi:Leu/Phe-tRNA-protein transferase